MAQFKALQFKINKTAIDTATDSLLEKWIRDTRSQLRYQLDGIYHSKVGSTDIAIAEHSPGMHYHTWLAASQLEHVEGFKYANHFIRKPIAWLGEVFDTEHVLAYRDDEEGIDIPAHDLVILNSSFYAEKLRKNETHCLVWINDLNYSLLKADIIVDDIVAEDKYLEAIKEGGEFYKQPETEM